MKRPIEDILSDINSLVTEENNDFITSIMEDISDTFTGDSNNEEIVRLKAENTALKEKYRLRFLEKKELKEEIENPNDDIDDEKKIIDIKEI